MSVDTKTAADAEVQLAAEAADEASVAKSKHDDIHPAARPFLFLGKESVKRNFIWFPLVGMVICIILGWFFPQAKALPIEKYIPGSWAIYGFVAYSLIVLSANTLFKLLGRDEDYYGAVSYTHLTLPTILLV